jgi:hypothetical protein
VLSLGYDEAKRLPFLKAGSAVQCPNCSSRHRAREATDSDRCPTGLFYVRCGEKTFIVGMLGRLLPVKPKGKRGG